MTAKEVSRKIQKHLTELHNHYSVKALFIFGSVARDEASRGSDIDLLVEFSSANVGLFEFIRLKNYLEQILKTEVDLVTRDAVKEWMMAGIERDSIRVA